MPANCMFVGVIVGRVRRVSIVPCGEGGGAIFYKSNTWAGDLNWARAESGDSRGGGVLSCV